MHVRDYYRNPDVVSRVTEFLGGFSVEEATCVYLSRSDHVLYSNLQLKTPTQLPYYLDQGVDLARSLWDRRSLIVDLDIEYVNFDFPAEPYLDLERTFSLQQPVVLAVQKVLLRSGIAPLHVMGGRGHHFLWRLPRETQAFKTLVPLGRLSRPTRMLYARPHPPTGETVPEDTAHAFAGLGLVIEYLVHLIKAETAGQCEIPVEVTAVEVAPGLRGREMISIDISAFGDPLFTRMVRIPFSAYRKPWEQGLATTPGLTGRIPPLFFIPLHEMRVHEGLRVMQDAEQVAELAQRASVQIPDQAQGTNHLVNSYRGSDLKRFHDWFYSQEHDPVETWPDTYDRTPLEAYPCCARQVLQDPNDRLLKPAYLRLVTHVMMALGWHPRHISGLIRSKYEREFGWIPPWVEYDTGLRSDFYTRLFSGLFCTGLDQVEDFARTNGHRPFICDSGEGGSLAEIRKSLIFRKNHDQLACRPFNRLLLPDEHF
ncbi:MAG: hypothetical protein EHM61_19045 [Acidobacteria bacterium]|nr:MAG: hypothetical protein EHM61_19045 [Acidobacteriota bacterium]